MLVHSGSGDKLIFSRDPDGPCDYCHSIEEICSVDLNKRNQRPFYYVSEEEYCLLCELCSYCFPGEELTTSNLRRLVSEQKKALSSNQADISTPNITIVERIPTHTSNPIDQNTILPRNRTKNQTEQQSILLPEIVNLRHDLGCLVVDAHGEYRKLLCDNLVGHRILSNQ